MLCVATVRKYSAVASDGSGSTGPDDASASKSCGRAMPSGASSGEVACGQCEEEGRLQDLQCQCLPFRLSVFYVCVERRLSIGE